MMKLRTNAEQAQTGRSIFSRKLTEQEQISESMNNLRRQGEWDDDAPFFYFLPREVVLECRTRSLPSMQELRDDEHLVKFQIPLGDAFRGKGVINHILVVSHRWEVPGRPDVNGVQLEAIKAYLEAHPDIEWVWFDYSTMPQKIGGIDTRTFMERAEYQLMLAAIADLYLTAHCLILLDGSYASRFWTLMEAWCSMQTATKDGLKTSISSTEDADFTGSDVKVGSRCTIKCIHNAAKEATAKHLVYLVSQKTPEEMYHILEKPDVNVTNAKDKETMLPKILMYNEYVIQRF
jgi:hypothetical protein